MKNIPTLSERLNAFAKLGDFIEQKLNSGLPESLLARVSQANPWFTPEEVRRALSQLRPWLLLPNLQSWCNAYNVQDSPRVPLTVAVVMAGNIPLVNFHDVLAVLVSGHKLLGKLSHQDPVLLPWLLDELIRIQPAMEQQIQWSEGPISGFQAVIATGSGNTGRYFKHYFGKYPHIIRGHRNSVGILSGSETDEQLTAFADDVFAYFGLGCRNISKFFIPETFNPVRLAGAWEHYTDRKNHSQYFNNYEYRKAIFLVNQKPHFDNGFLLITEDSCPAAPIAVIHYEKYSSVEELHQKLAELKPHLQCLVSYPMDDIPSVLPGKAQSPGLFDYPDHVDIMEFLKILKPTL